MNRWVRSRGSSIGGRLADRRCRLVRAEPVEPEAVLHDLGHLDGQRLELAEEVLADEQHDLDVRRRQRRCARRLVRRPAHAMPADDLAELLDEPVALVARSTRA